MGTQKIVLSFISDSLLPTRVDFLTLFCLGFFWGVSGWGVGGGGEGGVSHDSWREILKGHNNTVLQCKIALKLLSLCERSKQSKTFATLEKLTLTRKSVHLKRVKRKPFPSMFSYDCTCIVINLVIIICILVVCINKH